MKRTPDAKPGNSNLHDSSRNKQDEFYPDFVGELTDGRLFAVEYKGEHLRNTRDTLEKDAIGRLWAATSGGSCLYATVFKNEGGLDVRGQLDRLFGGKA